MQTREIPREHWNTFFRDFSRTHLGQQVRLWIDGPTTATTLEAVDLPLIGVDLDRSAAGLAEVDVIIGGSLDSNLNHRIRQPTNVRLGLDDSGADLSLQIDNEDGTYVFLALLQPDGNDLPPSAEDRSAKAAPR